MKRMDQINVIPFIDVMLVLLAIVLTTATFMVEGRLPIRLPAAEVQARPLVTPTPVEIGIDAEGQVYWASERLGAGASGLGALDTRLAGLTPDRPILLRVDAQTHFAAFVGVIDRLKAKGLERVSILTRRP